MYSRGLYLSFLHLFLLEFLLIGAGLNVGAVDEDDAGVYHAVVECFVKDVLEDLTGQLLRKTLAEGVAHRSYSHS